jgi:hypothetical protein
MHAWRKFNEGILQFLECNMLKSNSNAQLKEGNAQRNACIVQIKKGCAQTIECKTK